MMCFAVLDSLVFIYDDQVLWKIYILCPRFSQTQLCSNSEHPSLYNNV